MIVSKCLEGRFPGANRCDGREKRGVKLGARWLDRVSFGITQEV